MSSFKNPPAFEENKSYETWKNEIKMWETLTDLPAKNKALAIALTLDGKARNAIMEIEVSILNVDNGVSILLKELDKLYESDKVDLAYAAYSAFDKFTRPVNMTMSVSVYTFLYTIYKQILLFNLLF